MKRRPTSDYDEFPKHKENHAPHILGLLVVLVGALFYWWRQPAPVLLEAKDISIRGVHLGDSYQSLSIHFGKPRDEIKSPTGERQLVYPDGESFYFKGDRVAYMEVRGQGTVEFHHTSVKVGDSRDRIEKDLGVVEPSRVPNLTQITWPGPDCRFAVEFDADWKARALRVYAP